MNVGASRVEPYRPVEPAHAIIPAALVSAPARNQTATPAPARDEAAQRTETVARTERTGRIEFTAETLRSFGFDWERAASPQAETTDVLRAYAQQSRNWEGWRLTQTTDFSQTRLSNRVSSALGGAVKGVGAVLDQRL